MENRVKPPASFLIIQYLSSECLFFGSLNLLNFHYVMSQLSAGGLRHVSVRLRVKVVFLLNVQSADSQRINNVRDCWRAKQRADV